MGTQRPHWVDAEIAYALEAPEELLPVLAWLLQDLPSLGGTTEDVLRLLAQAGLPREARVLDLGCGRGEIALALAEAFDAQVTGIDAFAPFVEAARRAAAARGLGDRCRFRCGDLRDAIKDDAVFDAVLSSSPWATSSAIRRPPCASSVGWLVRPA